MTLGKNKSQTHPTSVEGKNVALNPHELSYAHDRGSQVVKALDLNQSQAYALQAMEEQTSKQMDSIKEHIELLANQAKQIEQRVQISHIIYGAQVSFEPLIGREYHLYKKVSGKYVLSLLSPSEWAQKLPFQYWVAKVKLLADHTWDVLELSKEGF